MATTEYRSRYRKDKIRRQIDRYSDDLKKWLLLTVTKSKYLVNKFRIYDHHTLNHHFEVRLEGEDPRIPYDEIKLKQLHFYDVIDIDSINEKSVRRFKKLMRQNKDNRFGVNKDSLDTYQSLKNQMDLISMGSLISISYRNDIQQSKNYVQHASVSFIKTQESFVIIRVDITPTELFLTTLKDILSAEIDTSGIVNYASYWKILRRLKFIESQSMGTTSMTRGLDNLFYDMQFQVHRNILRHLNGTFSHHTDIQTIPYLSFYEVKSLEEFHKDKKLQRLFPRSFDGPFISDNGETEVYLTELDKHNKNSIRVVRQTPVDATPENDKRYHQDIDLHFLLDSFGFPCAFRAILKVQIDRLNQLKRDIYDFTEYISNKRPLDVFSFIRVNGQYVRLKTRLTRFITSMKRFEAEFSPSEMEWFMEGEQLKQFKATKPRKDKEDLQALYMSDFNYLIKKYNSSIKGIQEVFKSVEELNTFRTNLVLQGFSVIVALMAIFFAFDKVKHFFSWLFKALHITG